MGLHIGDGKIDVLSKHVSLIAAIGQNRVIGKNGKLPWHLPADLAWFKRHTLNKPVVMGSKTFASIGKPLVKRQNIVLTRALQRLLPAQVDIAHSIKEVFAYSVNAPEIMIIGGAQVYKQFLPLATRLYLTHISLSIEGDAYFPDFIMQSWQRLFYETHPATAERLYSYNFEILEKVK